MKTRAALGVVAAVCLSLTSCFFLYRYLRSYRAQRGVINKYTEIACPQNAMHILTGGQSNLANTLRPYKNVRLQNVFSQSFTSCFTEEVLNIGCSTRWLGSRSLATLTLGVDHHWALLGSKPWRKLKIAA